MNQKASSVGELAARLLLSNKPGKVSRVFQRSAYVRSGEDFILLLWGDLRSPMTINVVGSVSASKIRAEEKCTMSEDGVMLDSVKIEVEGAQTYRTALLDRWEVILPERQALRKGVGLIKSLFDASSSGPTLNKDIALRGFVRSTLLPLSKGTHAPLFSPKNYLPLVGRGGGFTPAGDDFLGGLLATYNFVARCRKSRQIVVPRALLRGRTVPESANVLFHSSKGYVDEAMERLVLKSLMGSTGFSDELMELASRGHTSGMDMSLGVLLCEAAISDADGEGRALHECLDVLWRP